MGLGRRAGVQARRLGAAVAALGLALGAGSADADDRTSTNGASAVVDRLHGQLLATMKNAEQLGYAGRAKTLGPVLSEVYDLPIMARRSVGSRNWKGLSEGDQARFLDTFTRLTVANYAGRFDGYSGERFETLQEEPSLQETILVRSRLVKSDGEIVKLDYRVHRAGEGWRIVDVYMNGTISEIALRRSEYSAMLRREGIAALLEAIEKKIAELEGS